MTLSPYFRHNKDTAVQFFSVFMLRNHIPKLNITLPSEVLVSSDKLRPCKDFTFHNVLARQGFSYCNRARLNLVSFAADVRVVTQGGGSLREYPNNGFCVA